MEHYRNLAKWLVASLAALLAVPAAAATPANILSLGAGAVMLSYSSEYNSWPALFLIDGNPALGWSSADGKTGPNSFVIELPQTYALDSVVFDSRQAQEQGYPGISARGIEVWGSTASPATGFVKIAAFEAPKGSRTAFAIPGKPQLRWLKLVDGNWGHARYTELMEVEAYGSAVGAPPQPQKVTGVYDTNYGGLVLAQSGSSVTGCYPDGGGGGFISGDTDGRLMHLQWNQSDGRTGSVVMVAEADGAHINGLWYEGGTEKGIWFGTRDPKAKASCGQNNETAIADELKHTHRAILYGVHFASDSNSITPDSAATLRDAAAALASQPDTAIVVRGYTDATNTEVYNLALSKRRAAAVMGWLAANGIGAARLSAEGLGRADPVADNATPQGRALNRRVELVVRKPQ